ncbi:MAG TPA: hypothetical protein VEL76_40480, partial [Gemmataceae bacterium]|nr:hypothetical protein [Gemmataceae bacterium]
MSWRKLLVRGLVFSVIGGCIAVVLLYQRWTDPAVVRAQVIAKLQELFPGANISLDSARLHLFGGIVLSELRLTRRDDPEQLEFAHIPTAVLYHDKEHLLDGQFSFRKVVLTQPRVRVQRGRDGRWNLEGLTSVQPSAGAHPTVVVEQGTLILEDCLAHPGMPPVEINDVNLTLLNDPPEIINIEGSGTSEIAGMLQLRGSWERQSHAASFSVQVAGLRLTPLLVQRAAAYCRDRTLAALHLDGLADLKAELDYQPGSGRPFSYDIQGSIRAGKVRHPRLPLPWENLQASARCTNGHLTVDHLTADSGATRLELLKGAAQLPNIDQDCEIAVTVHHLPLDGNLCACLPEGMQNLFRDFQPSGPASVTAHVVRQAGQWHRQQYTLAPEGIRVCYRHFKYPAENITGSVKYDALKQLTEVDVKGYSGPQPLTLTGFWNGYNLDADARLEITATGIPLDEKLIKALPEPLKTTALSFHAVGRADGRALIVHTPNVEGVQCTYHVRFFDTSVRWNYFPLLLENITGCLDVYPTHWELRDCRGTHNGGEVFVRGGSVPPAAVLSPLSPGGRGGKKPCPAAWLSWPEIVGRATDPRYQRQGYTARWRSQKGTSSEDGRSGEGVGHVRAAGTVELRGPHRPRPRQGRRSRRGDRCAWLCDRADVLPLRPGRPDRAFPLPQGSPATDAGDGAAQSYAPEPGRRHGGLLSQRRLLCRVERSDRQSGAARCRPADGP